MSLLNPLELAFSVIRERNSRIQRLRSALELVDSTAVTAMANATGTHKSSLKRIADIAGRAILEDKSYSLVHSRRKRRMQRFLSNAERERFARG